jgi:hypothetical protein
MAYRLDIVAVGINYKSAVIVAMVLRSQAWRPKIAPSGSQGRIVESINQVAGLDPERDMRGSKAIGTFG